MLLSRDSDTWLTQRLLNKWLIWWIDAIRFVRTSNWIIWYIKCLISGRRSIILILHVDNVLLASSKASRFIVIDNVLRIIDTVLFLGYLRSLMCENFPKTMLQDWRCTNGQRRQIIRRRSASKIKWREPMKDVPYLIYAYEYHNLHSKFLDGYLLNPSHDR